MKTITKNEFNSIWAQEIGSQNDTWYTRSIDENIKEKYYKLASEYSLDVVNEAIEIIINKSQTQNVKPGCDSPWFSPDDFKSALSIAVNNQESTNTEYCPCCCDLGIIIATEYQTKTRWEMMEKTQPRIFKILQQNGTVKIKNGEIQGITAAFACGCRKMGGQGNSKEWKKFTDVFFDKEDKCFSVHECNPTPGTGKHLCQIGVSHHKRIIQERKERNL